MATTKQKAKKVVAPVLVGLDVGFGDTKRLSNIFPQLKVMPSAVIPGTKPKNSRIFDAEEIQEDSLIVTTEDGTFYVGNQAMVAPVPGNRRTQIRDRANDPISRTLFYTNIALSVPHEEGEYDVYVMTGLPNDDYDLSIKNNLDEFLNKSYEIEFHLSPTKTIKKTINIVGHHILRQPEGSVTYNYFEFDMQEFLLPGPNARDTIGIIDLGHVTSDFALFRNGEIIEDDGVNDSSVGVTEVYRRLRKRLIIKLDREGIDLKVKEQDLDIAVRTGKIKYLDKDIDVSEEVQQTAEEVAKIIAGEVLDAWGNETNRLELILLAGGGSHIFGKYLHQEFEARNKQGFLTIDTPQFSNVYGFYMYGCMIQVEDLGQDEVLKTYVAPVFEGVA